VLALVEDFPAAMLLGVALFSAGITALYLWVRRQAKDAPPAPEEDTEVEATYR
jgi:uncharacterized iron-regulated membrane protein